jgi:thioesterase domain-containing protein
MHADPALQALDAHYQAMPPVAALQLRIAGFDGDCLRLHAPLSAHVNDKGCAFGGSLASLMTLAGWGLATLRLQQAGLAAEVYVADSSVRYRAPLYADLEAEAWLDGGESWDAVCTALREQGRARVFLQACVRLRDGGIAAEGRARFVAIARAGPDATGSVMAQGTG